MKEGALLAPPEELPTTPSFHPEMLIWDLSPELSDNNCVVLSHYMCGHLPWQPREMNTLKANHLGGLKINYKKDNVRSKGFN